MFDESYFLHMTPTIMSTKTKQTKNHTGTRKKLLLIILRYVSYSYYSEKNKLSTFFLHPRSYR